MSGQWTIDTGLTKKDIHTAAQTTEFNAMHKIERDKRRNDYTKLKRKVFFQMLLITVAVAVTVYLAMNKLLKL